MILEGSDPAALSLAANRLARGGLVAFPTETVYGLGARADDDQAVAAIFAAKGRPADHPLIVHVATPSAATRFASAIPAVAERLIDAFWPGPLTLIVPRKQGIATAAASGHASIGLRCPAHPVAQALLKAADALGVAGVAAPSANRFGRISPTQATHVQAEFGTELLVLDGGACALGIESAIVDCTRASPVLLRPGVLTRAAIEAAAREVLQPRSDDATPAPGTLAAHYAPRAKLRLMSTSALLAALPLLGDGAGSVAVYSRTALASSGLLVRAMPNTSDAAGHELFAALRELDATGVPLIWVEQPPDSPEWEGVRDRLERAAAA
ncbi:MAG: L-threonylcarbamoyladenylate synthase [Burkholderiales bacterium]